MSWRCVDRGLGLSVGALLAVAGCTGSTTTTTTTTPCWASASSVDDCGGIEALVASAKTEKTLNVIALPPEWANYGEILKGFTAKYGIKINSANPTGSARDEIDAVKLPASSKAAPDVVDLNMKVALANTSLFAPYRVMTWRDIPGSQKETTGLWVQDYGGLMSIGYDSTKVPDVTMLQDLLGAPYAGKVALSGDPTVSDQALAGVMMASIANGGSIDDISRGVDFFHQLKLKRNFVRTLGTSANVKAGLTPVLFEWDYRSVSHIKDLPGWRLFIPSGAVIGDYYAQAVNKNAPHPAAARLWEEYLYSDEGQNLFLRGGFRPVRQAAMNALATVDYVAASALPAVTDVPQILTQTQTAAAAKYLAANWARATA